eukprot:6328536-Prymnesium_polylepis.1
MVALINITPLPILSTCRLVDRYTLDNWQHLTRYTHGNTRLGVNSLVDLSSCRLVDLSTVVDNLSIELVDLSKRGSRHIYAET